MEGKQEARRKVARGGMAGQAQTTRRQDGARQAEGTAEAVALAAEGDRHQGEAERHGGIAREDRGGPGGDPGFDLQERAEAGGRQHGAALHPDAENRRQDAGAGTGLHPAQHRRRRRCDEGAEQGAARAGHEAQVQGEAQDLRRPNPDPPLGRGDGGPLRCHADAEGDGAADRVPVGGDDPEAGEVGAGGQPWGQCRPDGVAVLSRAVGKDRHAARPRQPEVERRHRLVEAQHQPARRLREAGAVRGLAAQQRGMGPGTGKGRQPQAARQEQREQAAHAFRLSPWA